MDTILNLGLNDQTVEGLSKQSNNPRFAWDSYRRFLTMYSNVVMDMNTSLLEVVMEDLKEAKHYKLDTDMTADDLKDLVAKYKKQILETTGKNFPTDPLGTVVGRDLRGLQELELLARDDVSRAAWLSEQLGNRGQRSVDGFRQHGRRLRDGCGVHAQSVDRRKTFFSANFWSMRKVKTSSPEFARPIRSAALRPKVRALKSLEELMPKAYAELVKVYQKLEKHYRDMQDIEFTIERNKLWMLQTRNGKRTAKAALRIACEMIDEKLISEDEALMRIAPQSLDQLLHPTLDPKAEKTLLAKGLPASPGGATGQIVFSSEDAVKWAEKGKKTILVRVETSPEDIEGMVKAQGVLTTRGGMTSHAAVVARGMGKCCVAGCGDMDVDYRKGELRVKGYVLREGDQITLDGGTGEIFLGEVKTVEPALDDYFLRVMKLADQKRTLGVRTNADTPHDAQVARKFGAEGIGLCRTEHMFFGADRIDVMRQMIIAETREERIDALDRLLPMQRADFVGLFEVMKGLPVTIRLLDPPLHEFLPHSEEEIQELAKRLAWNRRKCCAQRCVTSMSLTPC